MASGATVAPTTTELYATLLGAFMVYRNGVVVPLGHRRSVVDLCRYLVAHAGRVVPCEVLIDLLWPEAETSVALHRLHVSVSRLRQLLDDPAVPTSVVQFSPGGRYSISSRAVTSDCDRFTYHYRLGLVRSREGCRSEAATAFRVALATYQGDYVADDPYAEWAREQRMHFSERLLNALTFLADDAWQERNLTGLVEYARQVLEVDELRERAHRHLMRAHYMLGQRACAVRHYNFCLSVLRRELGVGPSNLTQSLHQAILQDAELPEEHPLRL